MAFHWHGDFFPLPLGATHLASSEQTPIQAFRHGSAYGFLFHLEATEGIVQEMVRTWPEELKEEGLAGATIVGGCTEYLHAMKGIARRVFSRFAAVI